MGRQVGVPAPTPVVGAISQERPYDIRRDVGGLIVPSTNINEKRTVVRGLGEIAFRVNNLDTMQQFYEYVIGLSLMARFPTSAFFKIADGYEGHTQVLALFDRSQ